MRTIALILSQTSCRQRKSIFSGQFSTITAFLFSLVSNSGHSSVRILGTILALCFMDKTLADPIKRLYTWGMFWNLPTNSGPSNIFAVTNVNLLFLVGILPSFVFSKETYVRDFSLKPEKWHKMYGLYNEIKLS